MALVKETVIDKVEVLANGVIQVREVKQILDDAVTPSDAVEPTFDEEGNELTPYIPAVSNVVAQEYHRVTIPKNTPTPTDVQAFLDNSKA